MTPGNQTAVVGRVMCGGGGAWEMLGGRNGLIALPFVWLGLAYRESLVLTGAK
jgi:hypothetical protein